MYDEYDENYYLRRESVARELARKSLNEEIGRIHTDMANNYAKHAREAAKRIYI